jgi:hypothetical protein
MNLAERKAREIRRRYRFAEPVSNEEIGALYRDFGLDLVEHRFAGRVREVMIGHVVGISPDVCEPEWRWLTGHALSHFLLHRGNHIEMHDSLTVLRHERQAELFTGWLFMASSWDLMTPWELADFHTLPERRIRRWLKIKAGERLEVPGGSRRR